jgi:hypothetical protein
VKEALRKTEDELHKLIAVPAVELLQGFPTNLWQQLHTVRLQVCGLGRQAHVHVEAAARSTSTAVLSCHMW